MNEKNQTAIAASILAGGLIAAAVIFTQGEGEPRTKKFDVVMENNRYSPSEIVAEVGDRVIIDFENRDPVSHGIAIPELGATVPNGHVPAGGSARMEFVADRPFSTDAAVCGGPNPTDKTDEHGEELVVKII